LASGPPAQRPIEEFVWATEGLAAATGAAAAILPEVSSAALDYENVHSEFLGNVFDFVMDVWGPEGVPPSATPSLGDVAGTATKLIMKVFGAP